MKVFSKMSITLSGEKGEAAEHLHEVHGHCAVGEENPEPHGLNVATDDLLLMEVTSWDIGGKERLFHRVKHNLFEV
jgi:hypothetical protein